LSSEELEVASLYSQQSAIWGKHADELEFKIPEEEHDKQVPAVLSKKDADNLNSEQDATEEVLVKHSPIILLSSDAEQLAQEK
jgi:hypothetical protein